MIKVVRVLDEEVVEVTETYLANHPTQFKEYIEKPKRKARVKPKAKVVEKKEDKE